MAVDLTLLKSTGDRALGLLPYGGPGTRKTFAVHTCPPPILHADFEGGAISLLPWTRRRRKWNSQDWVDITDVERQGAYDMLSQVNKDYINAVTRIKPSPYVDTIFYDNMNPQSYAHFIKDLAHFDFSQYKTFAGPDSLKEFSEDIRTMAKGRGNELEAFETKLWGAVQDRTGALVRYLRNFREQGVFVYMTSSELIDKDYITDPRNQKRGGEESAFSIKGAPNMYGQMVALTEHVVDVLMHARALGTEGIVWVTEPETITSGSTAVWEAKDRTGRIAQKFIKPNVRLLLDQIYGEDIRKAIYGSASV